jgi:hypothetical protein
VAEIENGDGIRRWCGQGKLAMLHQTVRSTHSREFAIPTSIGRRLLPAVVLLLAGAAVAGCAQRGRVAASDDKPVFNTVPRTVSRASSLVVIGHATRQNRAIVERALTILRARGEMANQRSREIQRLHLKRIEEIGVTACDSSCPPSDDILGTALPDDGVTAGMVDCAVVLNMPLIQQSAREWKAPVDAMTALVLIHEQEHCLRTPDDRETPAVAAESRLAKKLRSPKLIAFVKAAMERLDPSGYWKQ